MMNNDDFNDREYTEEERNEMAKFIEELEQIKTLNLTRYETLFLSDSVTLLLEHDANEGKFQIPAKTISPSAGVGVPLELIHKIGMAVLMVTEPESDGTVDLPITISELYLIREVCQSYVKVNTEQVGYNLLRKVYRLILDSDLKERAAFENLIHEVDFNLDKKSLKIDKEESNG